MLLLLFNMAMAAPPADVLSTAWAKHLEKATSTTHLSMQLRQRDFERMSQGTVARRRIHQQGADRAVGAIWSDIPRDALWIAILDDVHNTLIDSLTEIQLPTDRAGHKRLYQRLDLPWPFTNRHWVIDIKNNVELYANSKAESWERTWSLADPSHLPSPEVEAIWTPVNDGGWQLVSAGKGTIIVYHVRTVIGGAVPTEAVTRWALATIDDMLKGVVERAKEIPGHYRAGHFAIERPDNSAIPPYE